MMGDRKTVVRDGRTRRARPDEAKVLSALALRSKGHWGYDPDFLEACRGELTLAPDYIEKAEVYVVEEAGRVLGFYSLVRWKADVELDHFFVDPPAIGRGTGRTLWEDAVARSAALGFRRLIIESDPHAEGFYRRLGAERIGEVPSKARGGRLLPLLVYSLNDGPG